MKQTVVRLPHGLPHSYHTYTGATLVPHTHWFYTGTPHIGTKKILHYSFFRIQIYMGGASASQFGTKAWATGN